MDSSEPPTGRPSPRQELRGTTRPTRDKVRKDPYKIPKSPVAPQPPRPTAPPPQHRPPVIIYTDTPKVIHTTPSDFMSLVQRLTGASSSSANAAASRSPSNVQTVGETVSSTARLAATEMEARTSHEEAPRKNGEDVFDELGIGDGGAPDLFSPSVGPNSLDLLQEPSPAFDENKHFVENPFLAGPNNFSTTTAEPSPVDYWDPFNEYQDFDQFDP